MRLPWTAEVGGAGRWWRRPWAVDSGVAALLLLWSVPLLRRAEYGSQAPVPADLVFALLLILPVAVRRRYPVQAFGWVALTAFVQWLTGTPLGVYDLAVLVCLYTVSAYRTRPWSVPALAVGLTGAVLAWVSAWRSRDVGLLGLIAPLVVVSAVWVVGRTIRTRRRYLAELEQRAVRLERERDALARAAVAEERASIAREMHDVVAHTVAVMVAQAEGAGVAVRSAPDDAVRALDVISAAGRGALGELRRMLAVLRAENTVTGTAPQPGLADLEDLVEATRSAGLPVTYRREGPDPEVEATMELAVYRIVQESLTNTLKHAGPGTATRVVYRAGPQAIEVEVTDDGAAATAQPDGGGHGLTGIRERAAMFGGQTVAGPLPGGGWQVRAVLPLPPVRP